LASDDTYKRNEVAYYYPAPYWGYEHTDWIKTLLLFFDGVSILLPKYMGDVHRIVDEYLAGPLEDLKLLHVLRPEDFIDQEAAEDLAQAVVDLLTIGAFEGLSKNVPFRELSRSRTGWSVDAKLSDWLIEELVAHELAEPSRDGLSVPMHPTVRMTILVLLAQQSRNIGRRRGLDLHPVSEHSEPINSLLSLLNLERSPSRGHIVALDLEAVSVDLTAVPLEDVLGFRQEHGAEFRAYARNLRRFATELALLDPYDRNSRILDRQEELADVANDLRKITRRSWRKPFGKPSLGLAGAVWNMTTGDPFSAVLGTAAAVLEAPDSPNFGAYSYLMRIDHRFRQTRGPS
jgi:hypothetical protein